MLLLGAVLDARRPCPVWFVLLAANGLVFGTVLSLVNVLERDLAADVMGVSMLSLGPAAACALAVVGSVGLVTTLLTVGTKAQPTQGQSRADGRPALGDANARATSG